MTTSDPACPATSRAGTPCRMQPLSDDPDGYCPAHSPARAAARAEQQRKGGLARRKPAPTPEPTPMDPVDLSQSLPMTTHGEIRRAMELTFNAMREGSLSSRTGAAMVQAARLALAAVNEDRDARIAQLEQAVAAQQPATTNRRRR